MRRLPCVLFLMAASSLPAMAQPDLSGTWELGYDGRSAPPAALLASSAAASEGGARTHDVNAIRWCQLVGLPLLMEAGGAIDLVQDQTRLAIVNDRVPSQARHVYLGGAHPDLDVFDPQVVGHSVGTWDGETLVVDTVGFSERGVVSLPGGGWRTAKSHLTERFRLIDGGKRLQVSFTWADPTVFSRPHTYEFTYSRAAPGTSPPTYRCDASDAERAAFLLRANGSGG